MYGNLVYYPAFSWKKKKRKRSTQHPTGCEAKHTHHQNKGSQAFCQGLAEQHMSDLEGLCQFLQDFFLFSHDAVIIRLSWVGLCSLTTNASQWLSISLQGSQKDPSLYKEEGAPLDWLPLPHLHSSLPRSFLGGMLNFLASLFYAFLSLQRGQIWKFNYKVRKLSGVGVFRGFFLCPSLKKKLNK